MSGVFNVYNVKIGEELWLYLVGVVMVGGFVVYEVNGEQYVVVLVGWGSGVNLFVGFYVGQIGGLVEGYVFVFKFGGEGELNVVVFLQKVMFELV